VHITSFLHWDDDHAAIFDIPAFFALHLPRKSGAVKANVRVESLTHAQEPATFIHNTTHERVRIDTRRFTKRVAFFFSLSKPVHHTPINSISTENITSTCAWQSLWLLFCMRRRKSGVDGGVD
jgi:hypothetical protein